MVDPIRRQQQAAEHLIDKLDNGAGLFNLEDDGKVGEAEVKAAGGYTELARATSELRGPARSSVMGALSERAQSGLEKAIGAERTAVAKEVFANIGLEGSDIASLTNPSALAPLHVRYNANHALVDKLATLADWSTPEAQAMLAVAAEVRGSYAQPDPGFGLPNPAPMDYASNQVRGQVNPTSWGRKHSATVTIAETTTRLAIFGNKDSHRSDGFVTLSADGAHAPSQLKSWFAENVTGQVTYHVPDLKAFYTLAQAQAANTNEAPDGQTELSLENGDAADASQGLDDLVGWLESNASVRVGELVNSKTGSMTSAIRYGSHEVISHHSATASDTADDMITIDSKTMELAATDLPDNIMAGLGLALVDHSLRSAQRGVRL